MDLLPALGGFCGILLFLGLFYKLLKFPKQDYQSVKKFLFQDGTPITIAHRAGKDQAPENTILAIKTAIKNGAKAVEIDLEFTKDGIAVILHDDTVERTTGQKGAIGSLLYDDVVKLNAAANFGTSSNSKHFEKIPTLEEAVNVCMQNGCMIDLDVKSNSSRTVSILKHLQKTVPDITKSVVITSFHFPIVYAVRRHCPEYTVGLICESSYVSTCCVNPTGILGQTCHFFDQCYELLTNYFLADFLGVSLVALDKCMLSERHVNWWRSKGIEVMSWTVNDPQEKKIILENYKLPIITDFVD